MHFSQIITSEEAERYLDEPFNPPAADSDSFGKEWRAVLKKTASALETLRMADDYGRGDYTVGEFRSLSRGPSVVLTSAALLN